MNYRSISLTLAVIGSSLTAFAQVATAPKPPIVNDPALKIELLATMPDVEACTTVCGAPDGSFYVGNDPRDGRLSTSQPVNTIIRFSTMGADKKRTVFADKIYSPAGSAWHDGYLYVLHDPLLTRFKDTNGDGVADVREDLVTNLGIPPNEGLNDHVVSGFTLGMDGFWYISVGDRGIYQAKSVKDGSTITMQGGGIARCRTDGTQLEVFSTGTRNHLQVNLDAEDNAFTRDNTDDGNGWWTRLTHHIEGGYYGYPYDFRKAPNYGVTQPSEQTLSAMKQHGVESGELSVERKKPAEGAPSDLSTLNPQASTFLPAMADFGGGSPTGGLCYLSDGLPEQYRGKHFFSEWGKAGVFVTEVARDGATFKLVSDTKLIEPEKGADFRPMQLSVAADGSLLIADWGYGGWKSPKVAGAIWRLSWPEAKPAPRLKDESKATAEELIAALGHPDRDQRLRAQWALVGKGSNAAEKLAALTKDEHVAELKRIHSIWVLKAMLDLAPDGEAEPLPTYIYHAFKAVNARVRIQGTRAIGQINRSFQFELLAPALRDPDPAVRLQGAAALGRTYQPFMRMVTSFGATETDRLRKAIIGPLIDALIDSDLWIRFVARKALARANDWKSVTAPHRSTNGKSSEAVWTALGEVYHKDALNLLLQGFQTAEADSRSRSIVVLGQIAYQPKPYGGHWWGTQPVKTPPPPNSVAWAGTPQALAALTKGLADADPRVRLAAAKTFAGFILDDSGKDAGAALRARLTAEKDAAIRRQLIESVGVQKDPQAMEVFRQIALDEKADAEFRDTAIGAVVNIGGDAAKETIARLAGANLSPRAMLRVIEAAGALKVAEAAAPLLEQFKSSDTTMRAAAVKSFATVAGSRMKPGGPLAESGATGLIALLSDKDGKVQAAAIEAAGNLREKKTLPALIALAEKKRSMKETIGALANMPDESAIPVLVEALREKNTGVRRSAIKALKTMREKAKPQVEALLASGRVPEELVPEIKNAFESGAIVKWKMVGVFENVWEAVHPPEKDALAHGGLPNLGAKYHNAEGKDVGWIDVNADGTEGRVDLGQVFKTSAMVCAYAFTEIDSPEAAEAKLFTSVDDEIAVWLNGTQVQNLAGSHGYEPDKYETHLQLKAGKNTLFVKIGNKSGSWVFHARIPGFEDGKFIKSKEPAPDEKQRLFALVTRPDGTYVNKGDAKNGEKLFFDQAGAMGGICATCHAVKGKGGQIGPDLGTIAANYKRPDLITSIHEPGKTIALGFEQVMVETKGGEVFAGALRQETAEALTVVGADGQPHAVKKADVKTQTHVPVSLMPAGLTLGLKPQEFADLLAYLETLTGK